MGSKYRQEFFLSIGKFSATKVKINVKKIEKIIRIRLSDEFKVRWI